MMTQGWTSVVDALISVGYLTFTFNFAWSSKHICLCGPYFLSSSVVLLVVQRRQSCMFPVETRGNHFGTHSGSQKFALELGGSFERDILITATSVL